jgi:hypothetical protein
MNAKKQNNEGNMAMIMNTPMAIMMNHKNNIDY